MKKFFITKEIKKDTLNNNVLIIKIEQLKYSDKWKNRYLLFNSENVVYKNYVKNCK